jgi:hypothetical protein
VILCDRPGVGKRGEKEQRSKGAEEESTRRQFTVNAPQSTVERRDGMCDVSKGVTEEAAESQLASGNTALV